MTAAEITNTLVFSKFSKSRWLCVPNVSWGWGLEYEADLIAVSANDFCEEVEIKINRFDLRGDAKKRKFKIGLARVNRFWYAVPTELVEEARAVVPERFGIIELRTTRNFPTAMTVRAAGKLGGRKVTAAERLTLMHLGICRYWDLRRLQPYRDRDMRTKRR